MRSVFGGESDCILDVAKDCIMIMLSKLKIDDDNLGVILFDTQVDILHTLQG